ncbi:MAG: restriction endonuclease subunit S [Chloroflexi bacterium]|nr:restriction endonuclease subunit S [Chloroflexota bacterium]
MPGTIDGKLPTTHNAVTPAPQGALPAGWRWVRLGDVIAEAQVGFASGARDDGGIIQLRMNNVTTQGTFDWSSYIRVPADEKTMERYRLLPGDVLFNNTNSAELVGKSALFLGSEDCIAYSNHFTRLRPQPTLDARYLVLWLQQQWHDGVFQRICNRWIGQAAVQRDKLVALDIPLPPLAEQRRIAAILTDQMAAVDRARAAAEAQVAAAEALPPAYLRAVFDGEEAQRWPMKPLEEVAELLPARSIATVGDTEVIAITTACLSEFGFQPAGVKKARMWAADVADCLVQPGEVLIARSNTAELVGRAAVFGGILHGAVASDLTIRCLPGDGMEPHFLGAYLSFLYLSGYWRDRAGGASGTMKKITRAQLLKLHVPAPPVTEQRHVLKALDQQRAGATNAASALKSQHLAINALPSSLLREAFNGRL